MIAEKPYHEEGLPEIQNKLRNNPKTFVEAALDKSTVLTTEAKILGYADNGISALITYIVQKGEKFALKIKPYKATNQVDLLNFLQKKQYKYSVEQYEFLQIQVDDTNFSVQVLEYIDADRSSHASLTDLELKTVMEELGKAVGSLHTIDSSKFGIPESIVDGKIKGTYNNLEEALKNTFIETQDFELNRFSESTLCHHALGLHNVFFVSDSIKIFDFKPILLPREFDLAMVLIWNGWRGEEFIQIFLDSYSRIQEYSEPALNYALLLEYRRKIKQWEKRVHFNPKVKDWIRDAEKEITRLQELIR